MTDSERIERIERVLALLGYHAADCSMTGWSAIDYNAVMDNCSCWVRDLYSGGYK